MEASPGAAPPASLHLPVLDGFRAVCVGLVLVSHLTRYQAVGLAFDVAKATGALGVACFFVLSGFLITTLLLREEARQGRISLKAFYLRRVLRIVPVYLAYLLTLAVLERARLIQPIPWDDYVGSLCFLRNQMGHLHETAHLWSVSVEEQFYLLWPLALCVLPPGRRQRFLLGACLAILVWRALLFSDGLLGYHDLYQRTDLRIDTLLAGCLLAVSSPWQRLKEGLPLAGIALALVGITAGASLLNVLIPAWSVLGYSLIAFTIAGLLALLLARPGSLATRLLSAPALGYVGRLSYSLYLWQQLFLGPREGFLDVLRGHRLLGLACVFGASLLSYSLIERPFLRWKERLRAGHGGRERVGAPASSLAG